MEIKEDLAWNEISKKVVVLESREQRKFHELNEVASTIWNSLNGQNTVGDILNIVMEEYEVDSVQAKEDIESFLNELKAKDLIND